MTRPSSHVFAVGIAIAAAGAVLALLLAEGVQGPVDRASDPGREEPGERAPPALRGLDAPPGAPGPDEGAVPVEGATEPGTAAPEGNPFLEGAVLAEETGEPIPGAWVWIEPRAEPCPRLSAWGPTRLHLRGDGVRGATEVFLPGGDPTRQAVRADEEGRFAFRAAAEATPASGGVDLFAQAPGRVPVVVCQPPLPGRQTLALREGLVLRGRVVGPTGSPVAHADVWVVPGPETPALPGHASLPLGVVTDAEGAFQEGGLLPGAVLVRVDHPSFVPALAGPFEPGDDAPCLVTLVPALRASFRIRTDDLVAPEHPTLLWETSGPLARSEVVLLRAAAAGLEEDPSGSVRWMEWVSEAVRVPCDAPGVVFRVRADGYAAWRSEPVPLPPEGGEETFEVRLARDPSSGSLRVSLEDERGERVRFDRTEIHVEIAYLDEGTPPSAYVKDPAEDLRITSLPAGRYRVRLRSVAFAPAEVEVAVVPDRETESRVEVRPPARLRVRFFGPQRTLVLFRLTQGGRPVAAHPVDAPPRGPDEDPAAPVLAAGSDGLLLSGLATGVYQVEVLSEHLVAPPTPVRLREGDTEEVEIHVRFR